MSPRMKPLDVRQPTIEDAEQIAKRVGARGVIIMAFGDDWNAAASYGRRKVDCQDMRKVLDSFCDDVQSGAVQVWRDQ